MTIVYAAVRYKLHNLSVTTIYRNCTNEQTGNPSPPRARMRASPNKPVSGTSVGRSTRLICSMSFSSGLSPPCMQKIFSSTMAATGRQLKQSVNVFHSLMLYRRLPVVVVCGRCRVVVGGKTKNAKCKKTSSKSNANHQLTYYQQVTGQRMVGERSTSHKKPAR